MTADNETKKNKFILPKEARLMMVNFLEEQGIEEDNKSDEDILKLYNQEALRVQEKVKSLSHLEVAHETKSLNMYATANDRMRVTDKEFVARLFKLNIHSYYLHLFKDDHKHLTDRELWEIVNKSGIDPVKEVSEISKMRRSPIKPKSFHQMG